MSLRRICIALLALFALPAQAAVLTVGASGCDHGTLSAAISAAQPGDELRLREQTFTGVSVSIDKSLTIRGGYSVCGDEFPDLGAVSVIQGTGTNRVLRIVGSGLSVDLVKLEITGGGNVISGGALVVGQGATARLAGAELYGNSAALGGAIYVGENGRLEHSGPVIVRDNSADKGGAIYIDAAGSVDFTTIGFNPVTVMDNVAPEGGGIYVADGGSLATDADHSLSVRSNQAQAGGGIYAETSAHVELIGDEVRSNLASIAGGGLFVAGNDSPASVPTILIGRDTEFRFNQAVVGGGASFGPGGGYHAEIAGVFNQNTAAQNGGGLAISGNGAFDLDDASFSFNEAGTTGGGVHIETSVVIADRLSAGSNRAEGDGGGIFLTDLASLTVNQQLIVRSNEAAGSGAGMVVRDGALLTVVGSANGLDLLLQGNLAESGDGGGLHVQGGIVDLSGALIGTVGFSNQAPNGRGGGAFIDTDLDWSIRNSIINGNESESDGSALYITGGGNFLLGGLPAAGSAPTRGPVLCDPFDLDTGEFCSEVRGNRSVIGAAIVIVDDGAASRELRDLAIVDNAGANPAAGVLVDAPGVAMRNVLIARNTGSSAIFFFAGRDAVLEHVSLLFNERGMVTGGNAAVDVDHSMFWGNGTFGFLPGGGTVINGECNLGRSNLLPDVFQANPRFITTGRGLYRLSNQSPALDRCTFDLLAGDLDGLSRPAGANADIGAFEGAWGTSEVLLSDGLEEGPLASPAL